jgi:TP901 family phage tail tape measure protein
VPDVGDLVIKLSADNSDLNSKLDGATSKLDATAGKMRSVGKKMSMFVTAPIAGAGAGAVMTAASFEKAMNQVAAVSQASAGQMSLLEDQAKELGSTTKFTASEAAQGMGFLAMAGFNVEEMLAAMPGVLDLAAASNMNLGDTADIVSNILQGFGKDATDLATVNDALVKAMTTSNVDMRMLGESMAYVAPVANALGMDFNQITAAVGLLGNAGIQGSRAGTSLSMAFTKLLNPSGKAAERLDELGVNVMDAQGNLLPFIDIIKEFEKAGLSGGDAALIFGQRAGPSMLALMEQGSGALQDMTESLNDQGITGRVAQTQMEGLAGAGTELKSAMEGLAISFGEMLLPALEGVADFLSRVARWFTDLPGPAKIVIGVLLGMVAIIGPLLILIGFMIPAITGLSVAFAALNVSMGVIALVILGIAAAIAAVLIVWKYWDEIVAFAGEVWGKLQEVFFSKWGWLLPGGALLKAFFWFKDNWSAIWEGIKSVASSIWEAISGAFTSKWGWLLPGGILVKAIMAIKENWDAIWAAIEIIAIVLWEKISEAFKKYFGWLLPGGAIHKALIKVKEIWSSIWDSVKGKFSAIGTFIKDIWNNNFGWLKPDGLLHKALKKVGDVAAALKDRWTQIWGMIKDAMKGPVNFIIGMVNKLIDLLNSFSFSFAGKKLRGVTILPSFEFKPFNIPKIPTLAKGGIVNDATLAMIGESGPEAVVPLSKAGVGGLGNTINVYLTGEIYGIDDFEDKVFEAVRDGARRGGFEGILATG